MSSKDDGSAIIHMISSLARYPQKAEQYANDVDGLLNDHNVPPAQHAEFKQAFTAMQSGDTGPMRKLVGEASVHTDTCICTFP